MSLNTPISDFKLKIPKIDWFNIDFYFNILLVLIFTLPRSYFEIKICFILATSLSVIFKHKFVFSKKKILLKITSLWCIFGILWSLLGLYYANPNIPEALRLFLGYPVFIIAFYCLVEKYVKKERIIYAIHLSVFLIFLINVIGIVLYLQNKVPAFFYNNLSFNVGIHPGYIQLTSHNIGALFYLIPVSFLDIFLVRFKNAKNYRLSKNLAFAFILICGIIITIIAGRRALWLSVSFLFIIFIIYLLINYKVYKKVLTYFVIIFFLFTSIAIYNLNGVIDQENLNERLTGWYSSKGEERYVQSSFLIASFYDKPVIGHGFNAVLKNGYVRSDKPYLFESYILTILFNTGIVGLLMYVFLIIYPFLLKWRSPVVKFIFFVSIFSLFIANFSNPYFGSFDFIFYIFLPFFFIDYKPTFVVGKNN